MFVALTALLLGLSSGRSSLLSCRPQPLHRWPPVASLLHRGALRVPQRAHFSGSGWRRVQPINQLDAGSWELKWAGGGAAAASPEVRGGALAMEQSDWQAWPPKQEGPVTAVSHSAN